MTLDYTIKNPILWWSNSLGTSYLYMFKTTIALGNGAEHSVNEKMGVRSLKVVTNKDEIGISLYFELNGKPVFMKGANYTPSDNFLTRVTARSVFMSLLGLDIFFEDNY